MGFSLGPGLPTQAAVACGKICSVRGEEYQKGVGERALVLGADNFPFLGASALHGRVSWKGVFSCHELSGVWLF